MKNVPEEVVRSLFQCNKVLAFIPFSQVGEYMGVVMRPTVLREWLEGKTKQ